MPNGFTISDALSGGRDEFYEEYFGGCWSECGNSILIGLAIVVILYGLYRYKTEHATNSNASVALVEFSAGTVGGNTSAPLDLYSSSVYARNLQDNDQMSYINIDPNAQPGQPGSAAWYVLNSDIMGCANNDVSPQNPWAWWLTENKDVLKTVAKHPAVMAVKQTVLASKPAEIAGSNVVQAAKQAVIASNPALANNPVAVAQQPAVIAATDAALNANADVQAVTQAVLGQPTMNVAKESLTASAQDQCPTIGKRMGDEPLTKSLMGY